MALADWKRLTGSEHFSVDSTLIDAWAFHKSGLSRLGSPTSHVGEELRQSRGEKKAPAMRPAPFWFRAFRPGSRIAVV